MNRRHFLSATAAALVAASHYHLQAEDKKFPTGDYVDMHTHLGQTWNTTQPLSAEELLRWMDAHKIAQAVVLPLVSPESSSYLLTSDFVLQQTSPFRDRLIPFCCVDPRTSYNGGAKGLLTMLEKYREAGAKGFGEHKPGVAIDDPRNMALYAACHELKWPLLFHLDNQRNLDKPGLPGLAKALEAHPDCKFIGHGPGWWASISGDTSQVDLGGYPKGKVAPGGAMDALMEKYPNLFADLSAGSGAGAISRDLEFGEQFLIRRQDRVMFGTDFLAPAQAVPQFDLFEQKLQLPAEVAQKIYRGNARRILGLS
ncbi:Amidohydrolase [Anatilimnocola aggregata]|uniref:Amidohydrolase n=1 Tax=Anatilimnocola aggregata TaxID=2528021 RepID=A0A517Y504_9BACT|nr:amidohydrolase family protein [Anatilimnocola aggregata]QDU25202.1 Amidohydrolase [Anatilimnocola aggregata]